MECSIEECLCIDVRIHIHAIVLSLYEVNHHTLTLLASLRCVCFKVFAKGSFSDPSSQASTQLY